MLLRPRAAAPDPAAGDRVRAVLAGASGGWVPPVEQEQGGEPGLASGDHGGAPEDAPDAEPGARVVGGGSWGGASWSGASWSGASRGGGSWGATRPPRSHAAPVGAAGWRLDPGHRGAVALVVVALLGAVLAGATVLRGRPQEVAAPAVVSAGVPLAGASPPAAVAGDEVVVAVGGEVVRPGLVRLPAGSRVDDAVRAAGGPVAGASTGLLNLARRLVDGEQVLVGVDPPPGAAAPAGAGGLVDLNVATAADLDALPGIGPVLAQRIVDWRTEHGRFASVEQLREVTGIGESKYGDLAPKVTV